MASKKFWIKQGDTKPDLVVRLQRGNGTYPDLIGATVTFVMKDWIGGERKVERLSQINDEEHLARHQWIAADTDTPGRYNGEFVVTYNSGGEETFPTKDYIIVEVTSEL